MEDIRNRLELAYEALSRETLKQYLTSIAEILNVKSDVQECRIYADKFDLIIEEFESASGHTVANVLRSVGMVDQLMYIDVLKDVAEGLGYKALKSSTIETLENEIVQRFLEKLWGKLNDSQKSKIKEIVLDTLESQKTEASSDFIKKVAASGSPFATIMAGNSAGFALYIAATSGLHAVASALGIPLSFGTYTALTSGLSVVLGPLGIVASGVFAAYKLGQPSYERKIIPTIMALTALRAEIEIKSKIKARKKTKKTA